MVARFSTDEADVRVSIGPSAGSCCYEVDEAVLEPLRSGSAEWSSLLKDRRGNRAKLDLKALVKIQAAQIGIDRDHITTVNLCTICHPHLFFSYRREGRVNGTMLNGITLMPHW